MDSFFRQNVQHGDATKGKASIFHKNRYVHNRAILQVAGNRGCFVIFELVNHMTCVGTSISISVFPLMALEWRMFRRKNELIRFGRLGAQSKKPPSAKQQDFVLRFFKVFPELLRVYPSESAHFSCM
jgi:hypothetical protein